MTTADTPATLRLLSWNVRSLRDGRTGVADVIRAAAVDVALIQEAPRWARWRSKRAALAREAGMVVGTADRVGGLVVLTSMRTWVLDHAHRPLPTLGGRHRRALVSATVSVAGGPAWRMAVTHLSLDQAERLEHARMINADLAADATAPTVLGVDVNDQPGSPAWRALADGFTDCLAVAGATGPTFPAAAPRRRIDAVFVGGGAEVVDATILELPAGQPPSDHLPLVVTLRRSQDPSRSRT